MRRLTHLLGTSFLIGLLNVSLMLIDAG